MVHFGTFRRKLLTQGDQRCMDGPVQTGSDPLHSLMWHATVAPTDQWEEPRDPHVSKNDNNCLNI
uniref:Uncharacterized protein n=1 Tax=Oryza punctata TaxID=4537 RepID=A0A0E0KWT6_ORYPU